METKKQKINFLCYEGVEVEQNSFCNSPEYKFHTQVVKINRSV